MFYVYVLKDERGKTYIGYSSNLKRRFQQHQKGDGYTKRGHGWQLCYYEAYQSEADARRRERTLKKSPQSRRWMYERIEESMKLCGKN